MKTSINRHSIIGGGLSALIRDHRIKKSVIYCKNSNKLSISKNFYENLGVGGNTNIWGGYINYKKYLFFLKNYKFKKFIDNQKIFKLRKLFTQGKFQQTYYLSDYNNKKVLRIKKKHFKNLLIFKNIKKISIKKNKIFLHLEKKRILTKKLSICVGNLSLIKLLSNSKIIGQNDRISFKDGSCSYQLNFFQNFQKNYYIPLTIQEIIEKLIFKKKDGYKYKIGRTLFLQKFSYKHKRYSYLVSELLKYNSNTLRYFLTNHTTDLRINNVRINKFIKNLSKNITVYNSGAINNYIPGPISQNIIFNALKN